MDVGGRGIGETVSVNSTVVGVALAEDKGATLCAEATEAHFPQFIEAWLLTLCREVTEAAPEAGESLGCGTQEDCWREAIPG